MPHYYFTSITNDALVSSVGEKLEQSLIRPSNSTTDEDKILIELKYDDQKFNYWNRIYVLFNTNAKTLEKDLNKLVIRVPRSEADGNKVKIAIMDMFFYANSHSNLLYASVTLFNSFLDDKTKKKIDKIKEFLTTSKMNTEDPDVAVGNFKSYLNQQKINNIYSILSSDISISLMATIDKADIQFLVPIKELAASNLQKWHFVFKEINTEKDFMERLERDIRVYIQNRDRSPLEKSIS